MQSKTQVKPPGKSHRFPHIQLKQCLNKVYTLDRNDKYELFLLELGVRKSVRVNALKSKPSVSLYVQNNYYVLNSMYPEGKNVRVRFKPGEKTFRRKPDGKLISSVFDISENVITEKLNLNGFNVTIQRVFTITELTVTMEVNGVKCFRVFTLPASRHTIETETSRRSSVCKQSELDFSEEFEDIVEDDFSGESGETSETEICY